MDAEAIAQREAEELMKERRELQARLKSQEKKVWTVFVLTNQTRSRKFLRFMFIHR